MAPSFHIIVCGAGLSGLFVAIALAKQGHKLTVVESASQLSEIGAGIQVPPNSSRILISYGLGSKLEEKAVVPKRMQLRRYANGEIIGITEMSPFMKETYGFPYWFVYRADLQQILYDAAVNAGIHVLFEHSVDDVGTANSAHCAYRAMISADVLNWDPKISHYLQSDVAELWIGPGAHVIAYPIHDGPDGTFFNFVLCYVGEGITGKWNQPGDPEEMRNIFSDWEPNLRQILNHISECGKWTRAYLPPLPKWVVDTERVVLIGDAAHGMLPYMAQDAALSIEDGAAMAECISRVKDISDVPRLLKTFESVRKPRCEEISSNSLANADIFHLPDGLAQEKRDTESRQKMLGAIKSQSDGSSHKWSNESVRTGLFDYDAVGAIKDVLESSREIIYFASVGASDTCFECVMDHTECAGFALRNISVV